MAFAQNAAPSQEDLLALNFYVQHEDQPSIEAELRRLRLKFPNWQPPQDLSRLSVTQPSGEVDEIFRQIGAGRYALARETIAKTRAAFPDWTPPDAMMSLLSTAEGQAEFDKALAGGDLSGALAATSANPGLLRCDRINNAWRIAEAQGKAGRKADALATYRAVLGACVKPEDLVATLEKADAVADQAQLEQLFTLVEGRLPNQKPALAAVRTRLLAGRGVTADAPPPQAGAQAQAPTRNTPVAVAPAARPAAPPPPAAPSNAAPAPRASGATAAGDAGFQAAVRAGDWAGCIARSNGARAAAVIYQRGWCAYNLDQPMEAISSFQTALGGKLDASQRRDAYYGMALAYLKMQSPEQAARIAASVDFTPTQRVDIERQILDQRGVAAYKKRQYRRAIEYFNAMEAVSGGIRRDLAMLRAYAYLNAGDRPEARRQFQLLHDQLATSETRRGLEAAMD